MDLVAVGPLEGEALELGQVELREQGGVVMRELGQARAVRIGDEDLGRRRGVVAGEGHLAGRGVDLEPGLDAARDEPGDARLGDWAFGEDAERDLDDRLGPHVVDDRPELRSIPGPRRTTGRADPESSSSSIGWSAGFEREQELQAPTGPTRTPPGPG